MQNQTTAIISLAHWEENIFYPHNQWTIKQHLGHKVEIVRI